MSNRTVNLLCKIGATDEASLRLTKANAKAANELKELGLVEYIPISTGGAWVVLTTKGIEEYEREE